MLKFTLNEENTSELNAQKRDPEGSRSQRVWFSNHKGLGLDLCQTKKSFFYKYKSPITGKFRVYTFKSFNNDEEIDPIILQSLMILFRTVSRQVSEGLDPKAMREVVQVEKRKVKTEALEAKKAADKLSELRKYTLNNAFDDYTQHRLFKDQIAASTQQVYLRAFNNHISPALGKMPLIDLEVGDIEDFLDSLVDSTCNICIAGGCFYR